jgi:hypothetical protein
MTRQFLKGISGESSETECTLIDYIKIVQIKVAIDYAFDCGKSLNINNRSAGLSLKKNINA